MINFELIHNLISQGRLTHLSVACGLGLVLGIALVLFPPLWVLVAVAVLPFSFAIIKRPEIGLLGIMVLKSTIISEDSLPRIQLGFGRLLITDIILLVLFGMIVFRWLVEPGFKINRTPLDAPLLAFYGLAILSTLNAIFHSSLTINESLGEVRMINNYLAFFIVANLVREERQLRLVIRGLLILATLVAIAMIVQYLLGPSAPILPGRVETLDTEGQSFGDVARIIPPGESLIYVAYITLTVTLALNKFKPISWLMFLQWSMLGLAVALTFKRNLWVGVGLAFLLLLLLSWGKVRLRMLIGVLAITLLATIILLPILNEPGSKVAITVRGSFDRLVSLANPQTFEDPQSSLRWRDFEYSYALPQIASHPLTGLGLGSSYRPFVPGKDWAGHDRTRFIHNGYLHIMVKSGLLAFLCFFSFSLVSLWRGFKFWRQVYDRQFQAIVLGFTLAFLGILIGSFVSAMIVKSYWTPVIGIMLGINEVILKFWREKSRIDQAIMIRDSTTVGSS